MLLVLIHLCCPCLESPDTSGGFEIDDDADTEDQAGTVVTEQATEKASGDGDGMLLAAANGADTSSAVDLSDGSDIFALEIDVNMSDVDSSFARSDSPQMPSVGMSPNQDSHSTREPMTPDSPPPSRTASTPTLSSSVVYHPTYPEEFVPAPGVVLQGQATTDEPFSFQIGKLLTVMPIPPVLKVPIWGAPPPPGETTLDGLTPLYFGEDSRVGRYAFYGELSIWVCDF